MQRQATTYFRTDEPDEVENERKTIAKQLQPQLEKLKAAHPFFTKAPELKTSFKKNIKEFAAQATDAETKYSEFYTKEAFSTQLRKKLPEGEIAQHVPDEETVSELKERYTEHSVQFDRTVDAKCLEVEKVFLDYLLDKKIEETHLKEEEIENTQRDFFYRAVIVKAIQAAGEKYLSYLGKAIYTKDGRRQWLSKFGSVMSLKSEGGKIVANHEEGSGRHLIPLGRTLVATAKLIEESSVSRLLKLVDIIMAECEDQSWFGVSTAKNYLVEKMEELVVTRHANYFRWADGQVRLTRPITATPSIHDLADDEKAIVAKADHVLEELTKTKTTIDSAMKSHIALMHATAIELQRSDIDSSLKLVGIYHLEGEAVLKVQKLLETTGKRFRWIDTLYKHYIEKIKSNEISSLEQPESEFGRAFKRTTECFDSYEKILSDDKAIKSLDEAIHTTKEKIGSQQKDKYMAERGSLEKSLQEAKAQFSINKETYASKTYLLRALKIFFGFKAVDNYLAQNKVPLEQSSTAIAQDVNRFQKVYTSYGTKTDNTEFEEAETLKEKMESELAKIDKTMAESKEYYERVQKKLNKLKSKHPDLSLEHQTVFDSIKSRYEAYLKIQEEATNHYNQVLKKFSLLKKYQGILETREKMRGALVEASKNQKSFELMTDALENKFIEVKEYALSEQSDNDILTTLGESLKKDLRDVPRDEFHFTLARRYKEAITEAQEKIAEPDVTIDANIEHSIAALHEEYRLLEDQRENRPQKLHQLSTIPAEVKKYHEIRAHAKAVLDEVKHATDQIIQWNKQRTIIETFADSKKIESAITAASECLVNVEKNQKNALFNLEKMSTLTAEAKLNINPIGHKAEVEYARLITNISLAKLKASTFPAIKEKAETEEKVRQENLHRQKGGVDFIHFLYKAIMNNLPFWAGEVNFQWKRFGVGGVPVKGADGEEYWIATGLKKILDELKSFMQSGSQNKNPFDSLINIQQIALERYGFADTKLKYSLFGARNDSVSSMYYFLKQMNPNMDFGQLSSAILRIKNGKREYLNTSDDVRHGAEHLVK